MAISAIDGLDVDPVALSSDARLEWRGRDALRRCPEPRDVICSCRSHGGTGGEGEAACRRDRSA